MVGKWSKRVGSGACARDGALMKRKGQEERSSFIRVGFSRGQGPSATLGTTGGDVRDDEEGIFVTAEAGVRAEWQERAKTAVGLERRPATRLGRRWQDGRAGTPVLSAAYQRRCFRGGAEIGGFVGLGPKSHRCRRHSLQSTGAWTPVGLRPSLRSSPPAIFVLSAARAGEKDRSQQRGVEGGPMGLLRRRAAYAERADTTSPSRCCANGGPFLSPALRRRGRMSGG